MKDRDKLVGNKVVTTVMSNFGLYKAFDAVGIEYEKTKVGDKYVYECMSENGYRIGGEQSGHIIFSKYATTGDGIITALKMMEVMIAKKMTLSQLARTSGLQIRHRHRMMQMLRLQLRQLPMHLAQMEESSYAKAEQSLLSV